MTNPTPDQPTQEEQSGTVTSPPVPSVQAARKAYALYDASLLEIKRLQLKAAVADLTPDDYHATITVLSEALTAVWDMIATINQETERQKNG